MISSYRFNSKLLASTENIINTSNIITGFKIDSLDNVDLVLVNFSSIHITSSGIISLNINRKKLFNTTICYPGNNLNSIYDTLYSKIKSFDNYKFIVNTKEYNKIHIFKKNNEIIFGTNRGLIFFSPKENIIRRTILSSFHITGFIEDFEEGFWCTTLYNGLLYIPRPELDSYNIYGLKKKHFQWFCYSR